MGVQTCRKHEDAQDGAKVSGESAIQQLIVLGYPSSYVPSKHRTAHANKQLGKIKRRLVTAELADPPLGIGV
jgi:hypothetical protein